MKTEEMYVIYDYENLDEPLCYCADLYMAQVTAELIGKIIDCQIVYPGDKPNKK